MKNLENLLIKFCRFLDEYCPNFFTFFLFLLCGSIALLIHKYRKKDAEDIEEQKKWEKFFNFSDSWLYDENMENKNQKNNHDTNAEI